MKLRPYQTDAKRSVEDAWRAGARNVLLRLPTGGGKTPTFGAIVEGEPGASCVIAHRAELVSQSSLALALYGIRHRVIGPPALAAQCSSLHLSATGANYISQNSRCAVAGVDTLIRRPAADPWFGQVRLWVVDEGHHLQSKNKWGRAVAMFSNPAVRGLAVTATPGRPDGRGLSRATDGLIDTMVHGPEMGALMRAGYLTGYRIIAPPSDIDYSGVHVTASGDLSPPELSAAVHKSKRIVGDIVENYLRFARGKLGITFCVDVAAAIETAATYRAAGVRAEVITGETPAPLRADIMRKFRAREILQLVNVDLLGEGVDVPAVEVVSMARRTASFIVYAQQFGRMLRLFLPKVLQGAWDTYTDAQRLAFIAASDKPLGILIDHVGNVNYHKLPDSPREWSLDRRERRGRGEAAPDVDPVRTCLNPNANGTGIVCLEVYRRILPKCPACGHAVEPAQRSAPEHVDGVMEELSPEALAILRGAVAVVDGPAVINPYMPIPGQMAARKRHADRADAQAELRSVMGTWGGWRASEGDDVATAQKRFFFTFGVDVLSAQALGAADADALHNRVRENLEKSGIAY